MLDVEHDGDLDVAAVNGRVFRDEPLPGAVDEVFWRFYAEPNLLFVNDGAGRFTDMSDNGGSLFTSIDVSRGLLIGDIDGDGDMDAVVTNCGGRARLFRNDAAKCGNWLIVRAMESGPGRDAVGAVVTIEADGRRFVRPITHTYGYLTSGDAAAHFGLGTVARIDRLAVRWPGGTEEQFAVSAVNQRVLLVEGGGVRRR
jgi:hypothetical protein